MSTRNTTSPSRLAVLASVALIAGVPVATWWIVGDLSEPVSDPDYMVRPLTIPPAAELVVGLAALVLIVASASALVRLVWKGRLDRKWLPPIVFLVVAGMIAGFGWRVATAGVIGANIGGGLVIMFGGPLVAVLVIAAVVTALLAPVRSPDE